MFDATKCKECKKWGMDAHDIDLGDEIAFTKEYDDGPEDAHNREKNIEFATEVMGYSVVEDGYLVHFINTPKLNELGVVLVKQNI